ncbi:MAG: DUF4859 domain-containing protein [Bacteroidaceae bacterium]|nr:DUF4859 domain-containing protein [Bacteroidaceae bacterium]
MKKFFTRLLALVTCMAASLTASAQFSATLEQKPVGYTVQNATFKLTEVAETLSTDTATLAAALNAWFAGEVETNYFFLVGEDGTRYSDYTQGGKGGFWMTSAPAPTGWTGDVGDDVWYNTLAISPVDDEFIIGIGQHPDAFEGGEELNAKYVLVFNEKEATFDITLKIIKEEKPEVPEATTFISKLTIVGQQTVEVEQEPRGSYASDAVDVDLTGVAEKLGTTDAALEAVIADVLYTTTFVTENELPIKTDSLSNESSAGAVPGWWFAQVYDPEQEITSDEVVRKGYSGDCSFYIEALSYDAESTTLTGNLGQYPGNLDVDDVRIANVYIIWGDKAYQITYKLTIVAPEETGIEDMNKVGSVDARLEFDTDADSYSGDSFSLDTDAVIAALGVEAWKDITVMVMSSTGGLTVGGTANSGGSWLTAEGTLTNWGNNSALFFEPESSDDWSTINVGQYPGALDDDTEYKFGIYFVHGQDYYVLNVTVKTTEAQDPGPDPGEKVAQSEYHSVGEIAVKIQAVPSSSVYEIPMHFTYNGEYVAELVGTEKPTLFTDAAPSDDPEADKYSNGYTCTPYPGFWMSRDGYVTGWSSANSPWGATFAIADAEITFYQYPGFSDNVAGKSYKANMYLVNEFTGAMVTFKIDLRFVNDIVTVEEVGSESIMLPATDGTAIDLTAAIDSLGLKELEEPLDAFGLLSTPSLVLLNPDGSFTEPIEATSGAYLNAKGFIDESAENAEGVIYLYFDANDENSVNIIIEEENDFKLTPETRIDTKFGFLSENKLYVFNLAIVDNETYVGISNISTPNAQRSTIYDLTGRRVKAAQRGLYIQNGRKVIR